jgi:hypothetical protein
MAMRGVVCAVAVLCLASVARAEEVPTPARWSPRFQCVCAPYCKKDLPCVDWSLKWRCDDYCKKNLPCVPYCQQYLCDTYDCKPLPACYPKPLCEACPR